MTEKEKNEFSEVAESLKKYRRADLVDQNGESILDELYVDFWWEERELENLLFF